MCWTFHDWEGMENQLVQTGLLCTQKLYAQELHGFHTESSRWKNIEKL